MVKRIVALIKEDWGDLVKILLSLFVLCVIFYVFSIDVDYRIFIVVPIIRHILKNRAKHQNKTS